MRSSVGSRWSISKGSLTPCWAQAAPRELDYKTFLAQALETEWHGRFQRSIETRLRLSRFPRVKTLEQFDFDIQSRLDRRQVRELSGKGFVERAHNMVTPRPPSVGKTNLSVALGVKAVEAGYSVLFLKPETLMTRLVNRCFSRKNSRFHNTNEN